MVVRYMIYCMLGLFFSLTVNGVLMTPNREKIIQKIRMMRPILLCMYRSLENKKARKKVKKKTLDR